MLTDLVGWVGAAAGAAIAAGVVKAYTEFRAQKAATGHVLDAEREAFQKQPEEIAERLAELTQSQEGLKEKATELSKLVDDSRAAITMGRLFNLYSKQIEKYQQETRSRATWSFIFAILAMCAGFSFLVWGGTVLLTATDAIVLAAGGLISSVGGGISGFITKTFLDVHRLSLTQLNRYFRQPVVNDHIMMAQRLADECDDTAARHKAYEKIIDSIAGLITSDGDTPRKDTA